MKRLIIVGMLAALGCMSLPSTAEAQWKTYKCEHYGFSMLVPQGTKIKDASKDGWGWLKGEYQGVQVWGLARLCKQYSPKEIERFGVRVTGIPAKHWKELGRGKSYKRWGWYREVAASDGKVLFYGIYGVGPRGSYLLLLKTTVADYQENKADYKTWSKSLTLLPGWKIYRAKEYGFSMLIPEGTKGVEKEVGRWGGAYASHRGVEVFGLAYKGQASEADIVTTGIEVSGIAERHWKVLDQGKKEHGWKWWKIAAADNGKHVVFAGYGVNAKRPLAYLIFLKTTVKDFRRHKKTYETWGRSIFLD